MVRYFYQALIQIIINLPTLETLGLCLADHMENMKLCL